jgi:hypothetical protein
MLNQLELEMQRRQQEVLAEAKRLALLDAVRLPRRKGQWRGLLQTMRAHLRVVRPQPRSSVRRSRRGQRNARCYGRRPACGPFVVCENFHAPTWEGGPQCKESQ